MVIPENTNKFDSIELGKLLNLSKNQLNLRLRKAKIGFASPMSDWYRTSLKEFVFDTISSKQFLESDIWNGKKIRDDVTYAYNKNDYRKASLSWKYLQAMILVKFFG